jgi:hypothetical protein
MGMIVGISGRLESTLGWILAFLSRGSATITIPMFHAVVSTDAQRSMLLAAASSSLTGPELGAFQDLMEDFRPRYGERSRLVHNVWGHSNDHPDKALWWRSSDLGSVMANLSAAPTVEEVQRVAGEDVSLKAMLYTTDDVRGCRVRLGEYNERVRAFFLDLWNSHPTVAAATTASTNAPPIGGEPQLDLPQPQTDP